MQKDKPTTVFIVEDHPFFREGVKAWLDVCPNLRLVGEAKSISECREQLGTLRPAILLLDLGLPDEDGLFFIPEVDDLSPGTRVIVLSQRDELIFSKRAIDAGARGYLMKSEASERLLEAISTVMDGGTYLSDPASAIQGTARAGTGGVRNAQLSLLSSRELQVFMLIGSGFGPKEIAKKLSLSVKTVETYRDHLKQKLGASCATTLATQAANWVHLGTLGSSQSLSH